MNLRKKRLSIGQSDYKNLIDQNLYYVDKTLFINDLITQGGLACLFPRPRRFGKTLNLSMLRYFFEKTEKSNAYLFEDKKIWQIPEARALQGTFPVIFLTFKSVKEETWEMTYGKFVSLIADEFGRHGYLLESNVLTPQEKEVFEQIISEKASDKHVYTSLLFLSRLLERHHQTKVVILIDEYDSPIHEAFLNGYYSKVTSFMRSFLGDGLKDNTSLQLSVITGILRTAKEGIFSGLNNLKTCTILNDFADDKFGFTQEEVDRFLHDYDLTTIRDDFRHWYNGYLIGTVKIYNPWSTLNCIEEKGKFIPYWANTSNNALIAKIIATSKTDIKDACAQLLAGETLIDVQIEDKMVLPGMITNKNAIWSLFLFAGYLTTADACKINAKGYYICSLTLPNRELHSLFDNIITDLFTTNLDSFGGHAGLLEALRDANGKLFSIILSKFIVQSMSWHDIPEDEPENSYHLFVLGFLVTLSNRYAVKSNRESGYGRYDIMIIPHDKQLPGYIIEFKKKDDDESMEECVQRALEQIDKKNYAAELHSLGITSIVSWGIACHKKQVLLRQAA